MGFNLLYSKNYFIVKNLFNYDARLNSSKKKEILSLANNILGFLKFFDGEQIIIKNIYIKNAVFLVDTIFFVNNIIKLNFFNVSIMNSSFAGLDV